MQPGTVFQTAKHKSWAMEPTSAHMCEGLISCCKQMHQHSKAMVEEIWPACLLELTSKGLGASTTVLGRFQ